MLPVLVAAASFVVWLFSQDLFQTLKYAAFLLAFNLLPSVVLLDHLFDGWRNQASPTLLLIGFSPVGGVITLLPWWAADLKWGYFLVPIVSIIHLLLKRTRFAAVENELHRWPQILCITIALLGAPIVALALTWTEGLNPHLLHQAAIAAKLDAGYRPESPFVAGVPLAYNYVAHIWLSVSSSITGIPLENIVAYAAPAVLLYCSACALAAMSFYAGLPSWIVGLVICCVFWYAGWSQIGSQLLGRSNTWSCVLLIGPLMAFSAFSILVQAFAYWIEDGKAPVVRSYVFTFLVMLVLVGCRAPGAVILLCATSSLILLDAIAQKRLNWFAFGLLAALSAATLLGFVVFLGYGSSFQPGSFTTISATPFKYISSFGFFWLPPLLVSYGFTPIAAGVVQFVALVILQAGFLTPFLVSTPIRWAPLEIMLASAGLTGIAAIFFLQSGGGSQFTFLHYTTICFSLLGGIALARAIKLRRRFFALALAFAGALVVLQLSEFPLVGLKAMKVRLSSLNSPERIKIRLCDGELSLSPSHVPNGASVVLPLDGAHHCSRLRFVANNPQANNYLEDSLRYIAEWDTSLKDDLSKKVVLLNRGPQALAATLPAPSYVMLPDGGLKSVRP